MILICLMLEEGCICKICKGYKQDQSDYKTEKEIIAVRRGESQNRSGQRRPPEVSRPTPCSQQGQLWDQTGLLRALSSQALENLQGQSPRHPSGDVSLSKRAKLLSSHVCCLSLSHHAPPRRSTPVKAAQRVGGPPCCQGTLLAGIHLPGCRDPRPRPLLAELLSSQPAPACTTQRGCSCQAKLNSG